MSVDSTKSGERVAKRRVSQDDKGDKEYTRVFYVRTTKATDGANDVLLWSGIPQMFSMYRLPNGESNSAVWVSGRDAQQIGPQDWEVEVKYSKPKTESKDNKDNQNDKSTNPADWTIRVSCSWEQFQVPATGAKKIENGGSAAADWGQDVMQLGKFEINRGVCNSAGELFDPPVMIDKCRPIITVEDAVKVFDLEQAKQYGNAVNAAPFWGGVARSWKCAGISTSGLTSKTVNDVPVWYYPRVIELHFNPETWDVQVLDAGTFYWSGGAINAGSKKSFLTADNQPYVGKLNGLGGVLGSTANDVFLTFRVQPALDFMKLNLPIIPFN